MNWYNKLRMMPKIVLPVGLLLVLALGVLTWQIQTRSTEALTAAAQRELAAIAGQYGNNVRAFLQVSIDASVTFAGSLGHMLADKTLPTREGVNSMVRGIHQAHKTLVGIGIVWEPNAFDGQDAANVNKPGSDEKGRFVPYVADGSKGIGLVTGYEQEKYYTVPKATKRPTLSDPYIYDINGRSVLMTTAGSPIIMNGAFKGIVTADTLLEEISTLIKSIKVYHTGYGGLLTGNGIIVTHSDDTLVGKNLFDLGRQSNAKALQNAMRDGNPYMEVRDAGNTKEVTYFFPITFAETGQSWYFAISAPLDEVLESATSLSYFTIISSCVVTLLVVLLIFVVVRSSVKPIEYLAGVAQDIAYGNLKVVIHDEHFGGEVGRLSGSMKTMIASLVENITKAQAMSEDATQQAEKAQGAMREAEEASRDAQAKRAGMLHAADRLEEVAHIVSSASEELSAQIEQSEHGASEQAFRVTETAHAMDQMNATVHDVARSATKASEVSVATRQKAEGGANVVQQAVKSIRMVQEQSLTLKDDMALLSENAQSINQIMGVISDIADQTNLLALNAAIEAARAGDAGRGFAVVADEVRKLAEKTMASTTDVGNAIRSIQQSADKSMAQVDATVKTIEDATALANESGTALGEIVSLVDSTAEQVRSIATASEEQSASSSEINQSISQVNSIATETARAMGEAARAVSDLAAQAQVLSRLIEDMKRG